MGVLLLNAAYQPESVIPLGKAWRLVLKGAARIEETAGITHTGTGERGTPSVLVLTKFHNVPRRNLKWNKSGVFSRDGHRCVYCGKHDKSSELTIDHVVPQWYHRKHKTNQNTWGNTVTACKRCNNRKGDKMLREVGMKFFDPNYEPKIPRTRMTLRLENMPDGWKRYFEL